MTEAVSTDGFETRAIHAGQDPEQVTGSVITPIFQTSTYAQPAPGEHTGFEYDCASDLAETPRPDADALALIRGTVADDIAEVYPEFAERLFGRARSFERRYCRQTMAIGRIG